MKHIIFILFATLSLSALASEQASYRKLVYAVERNDLIATMNLISAGARPKPELLHLAVEENRFPMVDLLMKAGIGVDADIDNGFTPLRVADLSYRTETAKLLKAAGAKK